jgi:hypothetical protein
MYMGVGGIREGKGWVLSTYHLRSPLEVTLQSLDGPLYPEMFP